MQILTYRVEKNKMFLYKIAKRFRIHRFFVPYIIIKGKTKMRLKRLLTAFILQNSVCQNFIV